MTNVDGRDNRRHCANSLSVSRLSNADVDARFVALAIAVGLLGGVGQALAQVAAPITVTPQTLAPSRADNGFRVEIPEVGALRPPKGAENLAITLGQVQIVGGFREVADQTAAAVAGIDGKHVTLAQIYAVASEIEAIHARAGYVLARVIVPAQDLVNGAPLRIEVIDGFIEGVDVTGLPRRVRQVVANRSRSLVGQRHIRLSQIEQSLLIANEAPGLTLRSTLMRGTQAGGTRLVLEGSQKLVSGSIGGDNQLASSLGTYGLNAQLALNSALGLGETIYGFAAGGYDVSRWFDNDAPVRVLGGGMLLPLGDGRLTINPEGTFSRTLPKPLFGAPPTDGTLRRLSLRANYTLVKTRLHDGGLSLVVEQLDEKNIAIGFQPISHDRYMVARFGGTVSDLRGGPGIVASGQISQGLGNLGAIAVADAAASGIGFSRSGASLNFTKASGQFQLHLPLGSAGEAAFSAKGQSSFGKPLFRSEQFALEGADGVSAYVGGATAVDEGYVLRAEAGPHANFGTGNHAVTIAPYAFAATGSGRLDQPTAVEPGHITARSLGMGLRTGFDRNRLTISLEYAHGFSSYGPLDNADRVNVTAAIHF